MWYAILSLLILSGTAFAQNRPQLTWEGYVTGSATLYIQGDRVDVQGRDTGAVERPAYKFRRPLPARDQRAEVDVRRGRGRVDIVEQPSPSNEFSLIVRIDPVGSRYERYVLDFFWDEATRSSARGGRRRDEYEQRSRVDDRYTSGGSVNWSGEVDHEAIVEFRNRRATVRTLRGRSVAGDRADFTSPLPRADVMVRLEDVNGRGRVELVDHPTRENGYVAAVRILDEDGGSGPYSFRLSWDGDTFSSSESRYPASSGGGVLTPSGIDPGGSYSGSGVIRWSGRVDGRVRVSFRGDRAFTTRISGASVVGERAEFGAPLPRHNISGVDVRKVNGRGDVDVVQQPDARNGYTLVLEIDDNSGGADDYDLEITWR